MSYGSRDRREFGADVATPGYSAVERSGVVAVATAAVLPVAAHRGLGAGQPPVLKKVATDALHRRGLSRHPHPDAGFEVGSADRCV